ncbi:MAG: hypothetical protein H6545_00135 [Bacteroidales bacterium]|nr:hypothetical protein [Bacteroidales bacterium]HOO67323.1 hypothetical protein [Bacteroidales bacterium]HPE23284.1 hypothetical protein [Bacteroidales bacterium]HPJ05999.1 hypothetical protein [Bacteroidales bacterium]HPQ64755.1 hypothetical protein [Bacteroidales bacterium]
MRSIIIAVICIISCMAAAAQQVSPITIEKKGLGKQYLQNGQRLDRKEINKVLTGYEGSADEFRKSSRNSGIGVGLVAGGCLVIGASSLISSLKDVETLNSGSLDVSGANTGSFLVGCGMALAGIPFMLKGNSQFVRSVNIYNAQPGIERSPVASITVAISPAGAGMRVFF